MGPTHVQHPEQQDRLAPPCVSVTVLQHPFSAHAARYTQYHIVYESKIAGEYIHTPHCESCCSECRGLPTHSVRLSKNSRHCLQLPNKTNNNDSPRHRFHPRIDPSTYFWWSHYLLKHTLKLAIPENERRVLPDMHAIDDGDEAGPAGLVSKAERCFGSHAASRSSGKLNKARPWRGHAAISLWQCRC